MAIITKYVNSGQAGNDAHTGDDPVQQPWLTIQHGVDWWRDNSTPGDTFDLKLIGAFHENVTMIGVKYSDITIETSQLGAYDPKIISQFCEARVPCGGNVATGTSMPGVVFDIQFANRVTLKNLAILLADRGVDAYEAHHLTLDNCCIHDNRDTSEDGAGFLIRNSEKVTVNHCYVWLNGGKNGGGGYLGGCLDATIKDTVFYSNSAQRQGGALAISASKGVTVVGCTIGAPQAVSPLSIEGPNQAQRGGGVWVYDSTNVVFRRSLGPTWTPTTIDSNTAAKHGGGIYIEQENLPCGVTLKQKTEVKNNEAGKRGGGIAVDGSDNSPPLVRLSLDRASVHDNRSDRAGGGIYTEDAELDIQGGKIEDNAGLVGGGIELWMNSKLTAKDTRIAGNTADSGGGINSFKSRIDLTNVTFADNKATFTSGGGITAGSGDPVVLENCTFSMNRAKEGGAAAALHMIEATVDHCTFQENEVLGPGLASGALEMFRITRGKITSNTFLRNTSAEDGGALGVDGCDLANLTVSGNTFTDNVARRGRDIFIHYCGHVDIQTLSRDNTYTPTPPGIEKSP